MTDLRTTIRSHSGQAIADLTTLVAIPSVSSLPAHAPDVARAQETLAGLLTSLRCPDVRIVSAGGQPALIARYPAPPGQPTVCLYSHIDVQPTGEVAGWSSDPFRVERRGDRLHGRGVADDKGGIAVHLAALRAFDGRPPVGVTLFVEGEEEIGSPSLHRLLAEHRDELAADAFVICDSGNWEVGRPAFTTTLRGLADLVVEVETLAHGVHSGQFGGVVPDALTALTRLLASLHDERGDVAVEGLQSAPGFGLDYPESRLRAESGLVDGVEFIGTGPAADRLWARPAISVLAIDAPRIAEASNTLVPRARAKVSVRLAPGQDAAVALAAVQRHLLAHAPWGARVHFSDQGAAAGTTVALEGPIAEAARAALAEAWGVEPVTIGQGGSIPLVGEFQAAFPDATILITAVSDPDSRIHGIDESLHLGDFEAACLGEALLLERLGRTASAQGSA